ncbi:MAG: hydrogenase maturation nickel metallochaperone HypA [Deltaproteobacteria bacterium]|nr:hydrogenase maturation nickel metallochaperone HypA [Deltaproteobacteria bacterium]
MHEMGIARSLLKIIKREMKRSKLRKLKKVRVKIGELTAVEPRALRFCFEASIKDTDLDGASLEIEDVPLTGECVECGTKFRFHNFVSLCPACGGKKIEKLTGTELDLVSIEAV